MTVDNEPLRHERVGVEIDDVSFAYLCDPKYRETFVKNGDDPEKLLRTYASAINNAIAKRPVDMAVTTHVPPLEAPLVQAALQAGLACAHRLKQMGLIYQCLIVCQGWHASTMDQEPLSHTASTLCQEPA